jgi:hypothetical protein
MRAGWKEGYGGSKKKEGYGGSKKKLANAYTSSRLTKPH